MGPSSRFAALLVALLLASAAAAGAAGVDAFYEATVTGDGGSAQRPALATQALRALAVRLTGRRAAAQDPALAALYAEAPKLAESYRLVPPGQVAVSFDGAVVEARLAAAGQRLWPRERPATLVLIAGERPAAGIAGAADADARRELERVAEARGVPLVFAGGLDAGQQQARAQDVLALRLEPLRALARQFGAEGLLLGRVGAQGEVWNWSGPAGSGSYAGAAGEALELLADRYGAQFAVAADGGSRTLKVVVEGVRDLAGYAAATQAFAGLGMVHGVEVEGVAGDRLLLGVSFGGEPEALREAVLSGGRLAPVAAAAEDSALHLALAP
jgi:hypothetical protein